MKRFSNLCISNRKEWDTAKDLIEKLEREKEQLREKLRAYETGCILKGAHCKACQHGMESEFGFLGAKEYVCMLNIPCGEFKAKEGNDKI